jgi:hypothetical protein
MYTRSERDSNYVWFVKHVYVLTCSYLSLTSTSDALYILYNRKRHVMNSCVITSSMQLGASNHKGSSNWDAKWRLVYALLRFDIMAAFPGLYVKWMEPQSCFRSW